jgi:hypothetical protein
MITPMTLDRTSPSLTSHLFTVRVWREELGAGRVEWRGKVQHALSGEARYFREWAELITFLRESVDDPTATSADLSSTPVL